MTSSWRRWVLMSVIGWVFTSHAAYAQRADENATASAEDALGTRVGNESVGLYSATSARGFNPQLAGNMRIEGLYYDRQGLFGSRMQRSQTMRVGLSASPIPSRRRPASWTFPSLHRWSAAAQIRQGQRNAR